MNELSPEERKRIFEEEKTKQEQQASAETDLKAKVSGKDLIIALVVVVIGLFLIYRCESGSNPAPSKKPAASEKIRKEQAATIRKDISGITITNDNDYTWHLNDSFSGYGIRIRINDTFTFFYKNEITPRETITIQYSQFTTKEGMRFDILTHAPKVIDISTKEGFNIYQF